MGIPGGLPEIHEDNADRGPRIEGSRKHVWRDVRTQKRRAVRTNSQLYFAQNAKCRRRIRYWNMNPKTAQGT